jgi:CelD/BcsL family acetyltransferase involved in cellulose biosynthesis
MNSEDLDPIADPRWSSLVSRHKGGLFHSPPWLGAVHDAYAFRIQARVIVDERGTVTSGVPFSCLEAPPTPRLVVAPFCDACDPLFDCPDEWTRLLVALEAHRRPILLRCLDARLPAYERLAVIKRARWHTKTLEDSEQRRWQSLDPATQRAIRKARREGVVVRPLDPGPELEEFHRMHVALRKTKYRMLAQPLKFFEAIARRFQSAGNWHAIGAWLGDRLIAGTIYLRWGDTLYYKFNTSSLDTLGVRPNSLLTWEGIERAAALGCHRLDLGPSDDDQPGLIRFKRQFGSDQRELQFLRIDPPGWDDTCAAPQKSLLGELTSLLTQADVPDEVTAQAGTRFYRYFA